MPDGFFFGGTFTRRPSVRVLVNNTGLGPLALGGVLIPAFVGQAQGGKPGVPLQFLTPSDARAALRGGELLTAVLRAFNPSKNQPGASGVVAVRVNPATQATLTLLDGSAGNSIVVTSVNYGLLDNQITITVAAGSVSGKKVTVADNLGNSYIGDNLGENAFSVHYTGLSATVTMDVTNTLITFTSSGADGFTVDLTVYTTIAQVVSFINMHTGYTAAILANNPNAPALNGLDGQTTQDVKTSTFTETRNLQAIVDWFNTGAQPLVTAARAATGLLVPANGGPFFLAGGLEIGGFHLDGTVNGGYTIDNTSDWGFAVNTLSTQPVTFIGGIYGTQSGANEDALNQIFDTAAKTVSANGTLQRYNILGSQLAEASSGSLATVLAHAKALASSRSAYVPVGFKDYDDVTGLLTTYPGYMAAAEVIGVFCGIPNIGDSATGLDIRGVGLEWLTSIGDLESLLAGACLPLEFDTTTGLIRVTRAITTWLQDDNFAFTEISTGICLDQLVSMLTTGLQPFKGKKGSPDLVSRVASKITTILGQAQNNGLIVGDINSPAWDNVVVTLQQDHVIATLDASPGIPLNFVGLTINATAFTGTVTVTSIPNANPAP